MAPVRPDPFSVFPGMLHRTFSFATLFLVLLGCAGCATPSAGPGESVRIARLWVEYRDAASFDTLSTLASGAENTNGAQTLRTQPEAREGFYFRLRLDGRHGKALTDGAIRLQVVMPDGDQPRTFTLPFTAAGRDSVLLDVGLTGSDWPYGRTMPLAWRLDVTGPDGTIQATRKSFLWEMPGKGGQ